MYSSDVSDLDAWQGDCVPEGTLTFTELDGAASQRVGRPVALISHGCDLENNDDGYASLAPVFELDAFANQFIDAQQRADRVNAIRSNRLTSTFFLPSCEFLPDSFLDFERICSVSVPEIKRVWSANVAGSRLRLTREGWWFLLGKLTHFFAREENIKDYPRTPIPSRL